MKCVTIPAPITLVDEDGKPLIDPTTRQPLPPVTLYSLVRDLALKSPMMGTGIDALDTVDRLRKALRDTKEGEQVFIDNGDHAIVDKIFDSTQWGNPLIAVQQISMLRVWKKAPDEDRKLRAVEPEVKTTE